MSETEPEKFESFIKCLGAVLMQTYNEAICLAALESYFSPKPARLAETDELAEKLGDQIGHLSELLGGPPEIVLTLADTTTLQYDTYGAACLSELLSAFHRCRRSVCRAQMFFIGINTMARHPDLLIPCSTPDAQAELDKATERSFWEHAEAGFLQFVGFWDRVGQLLDFVFFNIRQYERDGFAAVIDRIAANYAPVSPALNQAVAWKALSTYRKREDEKGFVWLISRRNLLVHSLHLAPAKTDNPVFAATYNHLEERIKKRLRVAAPKEELARLHSHLSACADLFPSVLEVAEIGVKISSKTSQMGPKKENRQ